jgi:antitoxin HicB
MADRRITNVELAGRLGVNEKVVRRLLDPDHRCRIDRLEEALAVLGRQMELRVHIASQAH